MDITDTQLSLQQANKHKVKADQKKKNVFNSTPKLRSKLSGDKKQLR